MAGLSVGVHADPINHRIPGGIGVYVRRLVEELLKSDEASIRLIATKPVSMDPAEWWRPNWWQQPKPFSLLPLKALYASWNYLGVPKVRADIDVVHATNLVMPPAGGARLVATVHDVAVDTMPEVVPGIWRRIYARGLHKALSKAAVVCTVSEAIKRQLIDSYSVEASRIVVTPEAGNVSPNDFRDNVWLDGLGLTGPFVLSVGTVEPRKNHSALLEAFAEAGPRLKGMHLVIAGAAGWGSTDITKGIEKLKLGARVLVTGSIGASALAALYGRASIFAMPSLYEGFGIPLLEAMAFGVPCMASTDPALQEVGGEAARYLNPLDTSAWADGLADLADDAGARAELSVAGMERASHFSWRRTADLTLGAYRQAAV
ncbi:MAG: glycosyltransferase family 4 protein [Actinomycetota bacterium]